jgi:phage terminase small subunit
MVLERRRTTKNVSEDGAPEVGTQLARMTAKQARFVEEYLVDCNATQAAVRAGYSPKTAHAIGWENLRKPEIRTGVRALLNQLTMSSAEAAMRLTRWGRGSLASFVRLTADGEAVVDLSTAEAQAALDLIRRIKQTEQTTRSKDGTEYTTVRTEIELHDAKDAVIQMAKLHGMFREDGKEGGDVAPTRKEIEEQWEKIKRLKNVEELEKMLVNAAKKQAANGG